MKNTVALAVVSFLLLSGSTLSASAELQISAPPADPATSDSPLLAPKPEWKTCTLGSEANDDYISLAKNTSKTFSPLWNDDDTPQQNFAGIYAGPQNGTAELVGLDGIKYTPNPGFTGSDSIVYGHIGCMQCTGTGWEAWCSEPTGDSATIYITVTH